MVSDSDLVTRLREILRDSDLETATAGSVRRQLEEDFGVDLSDRKAFLFIALFLSRKSSKADKQVKKRGGGFQKVCSLSPQLQKVVGESELPRTEVVKKIWSYIRENNLQDPKNRRNIICDESLHAIFRVKSINMFQMNKALTKHIWPLSEDNEKRDGNTRGSKNKRSSKVDNHKAVKKRGGGFTKLCSLSPQLQAFTGESELARTEVVKRLWNYIREKNLQNPKDKRNILCDESLRAIFRVNTINMFQMNKALSKHIWPLNEEDAAPADSAKSERKPKQGRERGAYEPKQKEKRQKKGASGLLSPLPLSDALMKFFGTGENALSRADVVKRMWEYIKQNDLQDPSDKRRIICDDKLKELFEVDSFTGFTISKLLTTHFIKMEE
ncbi:hypothetical protein COLO4_11723 [Corchorus olitorius]|uniref:DM2 domain-containing protein n=1 Tax=Corchorus olitorius TaxID=93759 RepID=A0A1R3K3A2_9ROSI|nr:hypothetical protein COLO4_11723 [Corchorus olitorius]